MHGVSGESLKSLFDSIFESTVLYPAEKDYYCGKGIFSQLKKADAREKFAQQKKRPVFSTYAQTEI